MTRRRDARFAPSATAALLLFTCLGIVNAQTDPGLYYAAPDGMLKGEGPSKRELLMFGEASDTVSFIFVPKEGENVESFDVEDEAGFVDVGEIVQTTAESGTNFTIPFAFSNVGASPYKFVVKTDQNEYSIDGSYNVGGLVIKSGDTVVSGEDGPGVELGTFDEIVESPTFTYDVEARGFEGDLDLSDVKITPKELKGEYLEAVKSATIDGDQLKLEMNPYRVGSGQGLLMIEIPSLEVDGETYMTSLTYKIDTSKVPPCVAIGGEYTADEDGYVKIKMFNLLAPPAEKDVNKVTLTVGDSNVDHDPARSSLVQPTQTVAFKAEENGEATLTCQFDSGKVEAVVLGDAVTIAGAKPATSDEEEEEEDSEALAKDNTSNLGDLGSGNERITIPVTMRKYSEDSLTVKKADMVMGAMRGVIDVRSADMAMTDVRAGDNGAIMTLNADVQNGTREEKEGALKEAFEECAVQQSSEEECDDMEIGAVSKVDVSAVQGELSDVSGSGLAVWAIVVIAVVGALAVLLLIVLSLWVVYRRSAEQSESDYSSSGPLGVPDPDDMLYQQSIVRDIYGRGDFENGGPSTQAAEERAREADLREEFARPPSTSNASRDHGGTDDASSTYTV